MRASPYRNIRISEELGLRCDSAAKAIGYSARAGELMGAVTDISGIAVGFLATGQALLCSMTDNFVVATLKKYNRFEDMLRMFSVAIHWALFLVLFSLLSYCIKFEDHVWLFSLWLAVFAGTSAATVRILYLFNKVLRTANRK